VSSLEEITQGLKRAIISGLPDDAVFVYAQVPSVSQSPGVVIQPAPRDSADFNGAFHRGDITWNMDVILLVHIGSDSAGAQRKLMRLCDPASELSIARAIDDNRDLGLDDTTAHPDGIRLYGGKFENHAKEHVGAVLKVTVHTST